ncbi:MAG: NAD(P)H-hydrate dehydratase [Deltaproteobacteria bacterium]|nr:NAD(P)H-hydrate dehydratase [Deltaproteobacteria bacterium]
MRRYGIEGVVLMENAGRGAAELIRRLVQGLPHGPRSPARRVGLVCGPGNNGGDGFVVARHLANAGIPVRIYLAAPASRVRGDAARNFAVVRAMGLELLDASRPAGLARLRRSLAGDAVVVDGLFGTGLDREVAGHPRRLLEAMNAAPGLKVALDVPSGLDADTGRPLGACFRADHTVTFGALKVGLALHPGLELAGEVDLIDIGAPAGLMTEIGWAAVLLDEALVASLLPARPRDGHKGTFGHLLVVAGSRGKSGAAVLAAQAGVRSGAGLVTLATRGDVRDAVEARVRETMVEELLPAPGTPLPHETLDRRWNALARGKTAAAVGPGCGTDEPAADALRRIVARSNLPLVVDADALAALAGRPDLVRRAPAPRILTPHPGELARMLGTTTEEVQTDRLGVALRVAREWKAVVVLKGARTVVAAPDGRAYVNPTGNAGMASGGSGDVLSGIVGGLLAQRIDPLAAACVGVWVHGAAGDRAAGDSDGRGLAARDLIAGLPVVLRQLAGPRRS